MIEPDPDDRARLAAALEAALPGAALEPVGDAAGFGALGGFAGLDLVVTCWRLPWTNARTIVRLVRAEAPEARVLVISEAMPFVLDPGEIVRSAGADGYVAKSAAPAEFCGVVAALLRR